MSPQKKQRADDNVPKPHPSSICRVLFPSQTNVSSPPLPKIIYSSHKNVLADPWESNLSTPTNTTTKFGSTSTHTDPETALMSYEQELTKACVFGRLDVMVLTLLNCCWPKSLDWLEKYLKQHISTSLETSKDSHVNINNTTITGKTQVTANA